MFIHQYSVKIIKEREKKERNKNKQMNNVFAHNTKLN